MVEDDAGATGAVERGPEWDAWWRGLGRLEAALGLAETPSAEPPPDTLYEAMRSGARRVEAMLARAEEADRAPSCAQAEEVLGEVMHDLRTPLVALQGFVQLLEASARRDPLPAKQGEYLEHIKQAAAGIKRLVDDLQTARRLEQGRLGVNPGPVELLPFLEGEIARHRQTAEEREVELAVDLPESLPDAVLDRDRVAQALGILVENAVRFTPVGGTVWERVRAEGGWLRLTVTDQGPGIEPDKLPRLLQQGPWGGRGAPLGLYICRRLAELHGGRVGIENLPEGGARLELVFPLSAETGGEAPGKKRG